MDLDEALPAFSVALLVPLILAWLSRAGGLSRAKPGELRYSRMFRWLALIVTIAPTLGVVAIYLLSQRAQQTLDTGERVAFIGMLFCFPALGLPLVIEFFRVRHGFDERGLSFRSPWSRARHIAWNDVASLKWRQIMKWLDIETVAGTKIHLSPWLAGTRAFAETALEHLPPVVLDRYPNERAALQLMVVGHTWALMTENLSPAEILAAVNARARAARPRTG